MKRGTFRSIIAEFLYSLTEKRRLCYKKRKRKRLKNIKATIIGNNCTCGTIYRDLDLQYLSPTANVLIQPDDFFRFVNHLEDYLKCVPEEISLEGVSYPVGVLKYADEQVVLRFMHEDTFEAAKEKWIRRCARVDLNNLYIVFEQTFPEQMLRLHKTYNLYKEFKAIPYPNKRMLLNVWLSFDKEIVPVWRRFFCKRTNILEYPTKYSKKRLMDYFDYISFLNKNKNRGGISQ